MLPANDDTARAPLSPGQETASAELDAIMADRGHAYHQPGHLDHDRAVERVLGLHRARLGAENRVLVSFHEPEDGPGPLPPVEGPAPLTLAEPALLNAKWDPALVVPLDQALTGAGLSATDGLMLRGLLAEEQIAGTLGTWDEDRSGAYLEQRYGAAAAEAYIADAQQAAAVLPTPVKAWLRTSGAHCHPRVIVAAAELWRRRTQGAGE